MKKLILIAAGLVISSVLAISSFALTVGFSQVGSESGWRTAFSNDMKETAKARGINLKFSDGQQKQEVQIKAVRSFIAQGVDAIIIAPIVETGWERVLKEAKRARIPVIIVDRNMALKDKSLFVTRIAADFTIEGRLAAAWLMQATNGNCDILELQGQVGATAAIDRMRGFKEVMSYFPAARIIRTQTGEWTRAKGKEVMESFLKAENGGKDVCALWAHNDDMAIGAIQAIKEAGLKPSIDMKIISVDAVPDIFKAMADGETNATIALSYKLADPAFDVIKAYLDGKKDFPKWIKMPGAMYFPATAAEEYKKRK